MVWGSDMRNDAHNLGYAVLRDVLKQDVTGASVYNIGGPLSYATYSFVYTIAIS
jgi:hypothetical protein